MEIAAREGPLEGTGRPLMVGLESEETLFDGKALVQPPVETL